MKLWLFAYRQLQDKPAAKFFVSFSFFYSILKDEYPSQRGVGCNAHINRKIVHACLYRVRCVLRGSTRRSISLVTGVLPKGIKLRTTLLQEYALKYEYRVPP